jgi:uncharacterized protein
MLPLYLALTALLATEIPALTGRVVDRAEILSPEQEADLAGRLEAIERDNSVQIVIATIASLQGEPLEDYSLRLAEAWRIGQKGLDNGVIVLVAHQDRKVRIEVGYGLEAVIPDGLAGRIIRERIAPRFRTGDFHAGLALAVEGLALAARREYPALAPATRRDYNQLELLNAVTDAFPAYLAALFGWFVAFGILWDPMGLKTFWSSAVPGTVFLTLATAYCGWLTTSNFFWIIPLFFALGAVAAPFGKFMDKVSYGAGGSRSWTSSRSRSSSNWSSSSSSSRSSSSSSSSTSSFSGGGGRFGGGGASGSW